MPTYATNRKAGYDYEKLEDFEAGLVLDGSEVKSIREGGCKLEGAHLAIVQGELWLIGAHVAAYKKAGKLTDYDPIRTRKVLIKGKELRYLTGKLQEKGLTAVPFNIYTRSHRIKLGFWLARGKKAFEKKQKIKERDLDRESRRYGSDDI